MHFLPSLNKHPFLLACGLLSCILAYPYLSCHIIATYQSVNKSQDTGRNVQRFTSRPELMHTIQTKRVPAHQILVLKNYCWEKKTKNWQTQTTITWTIKCKITTECNLQWQFLRPSEWTCGETCRWWGCRCLLVSSPASCPEIDPAGQKCEGRTFKKKQTDISSSL